MNLEAEDGLFLLINPAEQAALRKNLKDSLQYTEAFARSGYIGSVAGAQVYMSKAIPEGEAVLATRDAVTLFIKKGVEREHDRIANTRQSIEYIRKVALVALTDAGKVVMITSGADPRTGYTLLTEQPVDWAAGYASYYEIDGNLVDGSMKALTAATPFVQGKFYSKD